MFLEAYVPHFLGVAFALIGAYAFKKWLDFKSKMFSAQQRVAKQQQENSIVEQLEATLGETLMKAEQAQILQLKNVDSGQDDATLQLLKKNLEITTKARIFVTTNWVASTLDQMFFPSLKSLVPTLMKWIKELV